MNELAEVLALQDLLEADDLAKAVTNFEAFFDALSQQKSRPDTVAEIERRVGSYFSGMQLPPHVTLYDRLLLSLRPKDVIATFNWDPLLGQAFRRNRDVAQLPRLLFLHGNVDSGACTTHRVKGFREQYCQACETLLRPVPLLYPVGQKDYTADGFIANEWDELGAALEQAAVFTIFGYSAPVTDVSAIDLLKTAFAKNRTRDFGLVEVVDIKAKEEVLRTWGSFGIEGRVAISSDVFDTLMFRHPRRSCEAFLWAILQQDPWHERPFPDETKLEGLQEWIRPLVDEEERYFASGVPFKPSRGSAKGAPPTG